MWDTQRPNQNFCMPTDAETKSTIKFENVCMLHGKQKHVRHHPLKTLKIETLSLIRNLKVGTRRCTFTRRGHLETRETKILCYPHSDFTHPTLFFDIFQKPTLRKSTTAESDHLCEVKMLWSV